MNKQSKKAIIDELKTAQLDFDNGRGDRAFMGLKNAINLLMGEMDANCVPVEILQGSEPPPINLLDYYAAHAPAVPDWFKPEITKPRERLLQWPMEWAKMMLEEREKVTVKK